MRDYLLSLIIWILLPALLIAINLIMGWNILWLILEMVWFGFGISIFSLDSE